MKYKELNQLTPEELTEKLTTTQQELSKLRFSHAINPLKNPTLITKTRKTIARIKTLQNARKHTQQ